MTGTLVSGFITSKQAAEWLRRQGVTGLVPAAATVEIYLDSTNDEVWLRTEQFVTRSDDPRDLVITDDHEALTEQVAVRIKSLPGT